MDLRGYGGSDHSPRGYDPTTLSNDVLGVIACLGEPSAVIVGHGWGAHRMDRGAALADGDRADRYLRAHPVRLRSRRASSRSSRRGGTPCADQWPWLPERDFATDNALRVAEVLESWSIQRQWLTPEVSDRFQAAFLIGNTAHCAMEYHRWAWRSCVRADGRRFQHLDGRGPIQQPVLHIHGRQDPTVLAATTTGSGDYVAGPYDLAPIDECGHFPHEERPDVVLPMLLGGWPRTGRRLASRCR